MTMTLEQANQIIEASLNEASCRGAAPLAVVVVDAGGHPIALRRQDGASFFRTDIAGAKAWTVVSMATSSRDIADLAEARPQFAGSLFAISGGRIAAAAGGVPILASDGVLLGAIGISGDTSDVDEAIARKGIAASPLETR